jgi:hypothetical protein
VPPTTQHKPSSGVNPSLPRISSSFSKPPTTNALLIYSKAAPLSHYRTTQNHHTQNQYHAKTAPERKGPRPTPSQAHPKPTFAHQPSTTGATQRKSPNSKATLLSRAWAAPGWGGQNMLNLLPFRSNRFASLHATGSEATGERELGTVR